MLAISSLLLLFTSVAFCLPTIPRTARSSEHSNDTITTEAQPTNCKTLEQLLLQNYRGGTNFRRTGLLYPFFTIPELVLRFLRDTDPDSIYSSTTIQTHNVTTCDKIKRYLNSTVPANSICSWSYSCEYNPNQFPSFDISIDTCERRSDIASEIANRVESCNVLTQDVTYVTRNQDGCWETNDPDTVSVGCVPECWESGCE